jgi:oligopeptide/dipeptide ABC transporter ATP-binding protein
MNRLEVKDLTVTFPTAAGLVQAVRGVSFEIEAGKTLGIVGESGSGKSVSMLTMIGLTRGARISGQALFEGQDLLGMDPEDLRHIRGAQISMIFQDPLSSLHPYYKVGWQISEMIRAHQKVSQEKARARAIELLRLVGIAQPDRRVDDYPHQFSGGMRQRAMIAMALANDPKLLIADEPTTALDVTVQAQIIDLMQELQKKMGTTIIMITHDLGVVADIADQVIVMYAGKGVERADRRTLYYNGHHPYTRGLMGSLPGKGSGVHDRLHPIAGQPPSLIQIPSGCPFHPRCPFVMNRCMSEEPPLLDVGNEPDHRSACWLPADLTGYDRQVDERRWSFAEGNRSGRAATLGRRHRITLEPEPAS